MQITLPPRRIAQFFAALVLCLVTAHVAVQAVSFATGDRSLYGLVFFFSLGAETNLPAFYSSVALLFAALLLALIGFQSRGDARIGVWYWFGLAAVFAFLSTDEMLAIHERLIEPVRTRLNASGLLYYAWVIPYGLAMLVFLAVYTRFLLRLPRRSAVLFVVAGLIYVTGAMGAEMIGGWYSQQHGNDNVVYVAIQTLEEVMEMVGIVLFIHALVDHMDRHLGGVNLFVTSGSPVEPLDALAPLARGADRARSRQVGP